MDGPVEPGGLWRVQTVAHIRALAADGEHVYVCRLADEKLRALAERPALRTIFSDGNSRAADGGVAAVAGLPALEQLDLEWSEEITDSAVAHLHTAPVLRRVDLSGCTRATPATIAALRAAHPGIEIESFAV